MAANQDPPNSPEFSKEDIEVYTPSNEDEASLNVFGRRRLRILNGQDPEEMPHKFTPIPSQHMQWPSNEEAYAWAKAAIWNVRKRDGQLFEPEQNKKHKTPGGAAGSCSTPATGDENLQPQQAAPPPAAVPFQLSSQ